ncbi:MAG TPA: MBL fold metallo-hydrolase [Clostridiaceae bacterium]|nr:MBL fold metallo-hydrolase [Clostridiaceae bacterium]HBF78012.1 MBL fold metallo-hydrolase [Clostridiaceae bacterium]HBG37770.1 MBL fold metallo-hydrolase [Clostridiaceae bacterium]HBN28890.1 MBL fold metallo-hydrolase [Clostridiaceae bacterium]HBX47544.1 MBL fold metallo-hydrolase [Clostridiaceae bacterium]
MMLNKIKGSSYYIDAPTNIGVYVFKNKNCLLVDSGINSTQAKKIDEVLIQNDLHPKYIINTHSHIDHCGGNLYFKNNYPGVLIYTSQSEKLFMDNPLLHSYAQYSANPIKEIVRNNKVVPVDSVIDYGLNKINDEKFEIIPLKGHSIEQIGILTPEKVCYLGDSIFSENIIEKYSFPYLINIEDSINTLKSIADIDGDFFMVSHSSVLYTKNEIVALVNKNLQNIEDYINQISDLLDQPLTKEDLLENLIIINELKVKSLNEYHNYFSSVSAFLSYLYEKSNISFSIEDGKVYYFKKA